MKRLLGYCDEIRVRPGQTINFKVSSEDAGAFRLDIVHVRSGDDTPSGPGLKERVVDAAVNGSFPARYQWTQVGSYVAVENTAPFALQSFTLQCFIWPTLLEKEDQVLMGAFNRADKAGYALALENGQAVLRIGDGKSVETLASGAAMDQHRWYFVAASFDAQSGKAHVVQEPLLRYAGDRGKASVEGTMKLRPDQTLVIRRHWPGPADRVRGLKEEMGALADLAQTGRG